MNALVFDLPKESACEFCGKAVPVEGYPMHARVRVGRLTVSFAHDGCPDRSGEPVRPLVLAEKKRLLLRYVYVPFIAGMVAGSAVTWLAWGLR